MSTTIFNFFKIFCEQGIFSCFRNFCYKVSARTPAFRPFSQRSPYFTPYLCPLLAVWGHGLHNIHRSGLPKTRVFIIFIHPQHLPIRIHHFSLLLPYFATFSHISPISSPLHKYRSKHRPFPTKRSIFAPFFIKKYIKNYYFYLIFLLENVGILHFMLSFVVFLILFSMFFRSPQLCTSIAPFLRSPATTVTKQQGSATSSISFCVKAV